MIKKKSGSDPAILHCDCNAFYASVEELLHPELRKVPMAVCGNPESRRGVILAKNEKARQKGVRTAETIWQARAKCPDLVLTPARHHRYREYSRRINSIYEEYTDRVERFGIDESFLDVTGSLHLFGGDAQELAHTIRRRIRQDIGLTISVGVSWNKIFAKLGSDYRKPDAVTVISKENYRDVVWPLPVSALFLVGRKTAETLYGLNINTIGDLANSNPDLLHRRFGKIGEQLHLYANGQDTGEVLYTDEARDLQSVGNGITFRRNLLTEKDIRTGITALCDSVAARMRHAAVQCAAVQVTIKDDSLKVITRQKTLPVPSDLSTDLVHASMELINANWRVGTPIRMLTVTALRLIPADTAAEQLSLFQPFSETDREKREKLEQTMDSIREKYGTDSLTPGSILHNDLGINEHYGEDEEETTGGKQSHCS